ncbi:hypothetical protein P3102_20175 [Amycolatopsis sp. QT-25]|uniref:hypothetical protein n=1 Tax=Amycolatopsis sp. QT-25 TaxID=3034022 RepID=UPI0023EB25F6|nr:hypothetical protein [Amycolatopsis sp. QT-25]WET76446.1 hypothetical protein P3102_20175 [Amycolatopsis sp. QT-25]
MSISAFTAAAFLATTPAAIAEPAPAQPALPLLGPLLGTVTQSLGVAQSGAEISTLLPNGLLGG